MKVTRKNLYTLLIIGTLAFFVVILAFSKKKPAEGIPMYKDPKGSYGLSAEWLNTKKAIDGLLQQIKENPQNYKAMLNLSQAYIQESRTTGDHAYYDKAALDLLEMILKKDPKNFDALCCKATVLLSQHHFADGKEIALQAEQINPYSAFIYGLLCDANVELGDYPEAVKMADKMISIRPDLRSYSRVSYLREIYGDMPGAISAMKLAVSAGYPGLEQTEWTRCVLGHLYENIGTPDSAEMEYRIALQERPDYPFAIAGLGHLALCKGNYKEAITDYEKANELITEYSFSDELTDLYLLNNEKDKSAASAQKVIEMLSPNTNVEGTTGHGHYADRELAFAYIKAGDLDAALLHAQTEYDRRPQNIDVCEMMAWVLYKRGDYLNASKMINTSLRTNSKNPVLLCRAGLIKAKTGEYAVGPALFREALQLNPFLDPMLKQEAKQYLPVN